MQTIIIDEEFRSLLPALNKETSRLLEENLLENGCRDPLILWDGVLIDGYNRYRICTEHGIPFSTISKEFDDRDQVLIWIITNQITRRNLTPYQLRYFRGLHYHADRRIFQNTEGINQHSEVFRQNGGNPQTLATSRKLAEKYNVSPRTIERDSRLADALIAIGGASPEAKQSILSGETKITRKELDAILSSPEDVAAEIAESIDNGTFVERRVDLASDNVRTLDSAFSRISALIERELNGLAKAYKPSEVKSALRSHIARLEDIYKQL